jgi:hypothetical protein
MIDHNKIKAAIDYYFLNTPTEQIIKNLDLHSIDRQENIERENVDNLLAQPPK